MKDTKRVMIIDALNMYFRAYIVDPSLSLNGQPIGGMKGFLKILQKLMREVRPDQVVVAWDGPGGSKRKRTVNKNYKEGRKPIRLNRGIQGLLNENEELENKIWQQTRLVDFINHMPISQVMIPDIEADDVIAHIVNMPELKEHQKVIISSDKDFLQLCNETTLLYRPIQKEVLNQHRITDKFGIHPNNFALARAVVGDKSDNLKGVAGAGLKTVAKRFTFLAEEESCTITKLINYCKGVDSSLKIYHNIVENEDLIKENYKLMQLYFPAISVQSKQIVKNAVLNLDCTFNKTEVIKMMNEDGFGAFDWSTLWQTCQHILHQKSQEGRID